MLGMSERAVKDGENAGLLDAPERAVVEQAMACWTTPRGRTLLAHGGRSPASCSAAQRTTSWPGVPRASEPRKARAAARAAASAPASPARAAASSGPAPGASGMASPGMVSPRAAPGMLSPGMRNAAPRDSRGRGVGARDAPRGNAAAANRGFWDGALDGVGGTAYVPPRRQASVEAPPSGADVTSRFEVPDE